jgi:hypothetical protein
MLRRYLFRTVRTTVEESAERSALLNRRQEAMYEPIDDAGRRGYS